jgi:hypothetical protein
MVPGKKIAFLSEPIPGMKDGKLQSSLETNLRLGVVDLEADARHNPPRSDRIAARLGGTGGAPDDAQPREIAEIPDCILGETRRERVVLRIATFFR